ncbi:MAG: 2Fe-2S iron-sulfur cluster-binding protein [Bryobacteraceae bacterium]
MSGNGKTLSMQMAEQCFKSLCFYPVVRIWQKTPLNWDSRYQSLLELAETCDVPVRWSCRTGVCHTCECGLIGGTVEYQPDPLEAPGNGNLLVCCSIPRTDIQLDL